MTKINPEDISCFSNDEELLDDVDLDIQIHCSSEAQLYKQSILQNQEIVERLKERLEIIMKTKDFIATPINLREYSLLLLNSILKTPTDN